MAKIGVILSGCGVFDGSEVRESVLALLALSELGQTNPLRLFSHDLTIRHDISGSFQTGL